MSEIDTLRQRADTAEAERERLKAALSECKQLAREGCEAPAVGYRYCERIECVAADALGAVEAA